MNKVSADLTDEETHVERSYVTPPKEQLINDKTEISNPDLPFSIDLLLAMMPCHIPWDTMLLRRISKARVTNPHVRSG